MQDPQDAVAEGVAAPERKPKSRWWIKPAPGPEAPDARDRKGAQLGLALAIGGAGLFWALLGAAVVLLRHV